MHETIEAQFQNALAHAQMATLQSLSPLVPEASTRRYFRLFLEDDSTCVGVFENPETAKKTMPRVVAVQRFLENGGIAVPRIYFTDTHAGVMLQQDLGDVSLNTALKAHPKKTEQLYRQAIQNMYGWQRLKDDGACPAFRLEFDVQKLMFEFDFYIEHTLLGYWQQALTESDLSRIRNQFLAVAEKLAAYPHKVFTHRDYHSRNVMLATDSSTQYIIDFQDARLGLVQYDLCSLLYDAYAQLESSVRNTLVLFAYEAAKELHRQTRDEFIHYFYLSAYQRTIKAMGTFGYQASQGRRDFAAYLDPAQAMLREIISNNKLGNISTLLDTIL